MARVQVSLLLVVFFTVFGSNAFLQGDSCVGRCGQAVSNSPCQCNSHCERFNDCCADYNAVCGSGGSCPSITTVTEQMWALDYNRLSSSEFTVHYQGRIGSTVSDHSGGPLLTNVNTAKLSTGTYALFRALLDNYNPYRNVREVETSQELAEEDAFFKAILDTPVMEVLLNYSICRGVPCRWSKRSNQGWATDKASLRQRLQVAWFDEYERSVSTAQGPDSSGFEHVLVGEYSGTKVGGLHNWVAFYELENSGAMNYYGYIRKADPYLLSCAFNWNGHVKNIGGFAIGTSPEFDMALFSLAFWNSPSGGNTQISLNGQPATVTTYNTNGHVATAYIAV